MKNILITTSTFGEQDPSIIETLKEYGFNVILNPFKRKLTEEELCELFMEYDPIGMIAGVEPITKNALEKTRKLKVISRCGVGLDNVDMDYASSRQIKVLRTPDAPTNAVKELTIGLIFEGLRKINRTDRSIRRGEWKRFQGRLLSNQTVGIVGLGRIGQSVAQFLYSYGCEVIGFDVVDHAKPFVKQKDLNYVFEKSDIITFHVPKNKDTEHMLSYQTINKLKEDILIINTARGDIIQEAALLEFLQNNPNAHACIDTFEQEPYSGKLCELNNITLTSHIGSYTNETRIEMERESLDNLLNHLN